MYFLVSYLAMLPKSQKFGVEWVKLLIFGSISIFWISQIKIPEKNKWCRKKNPTSLKMIIFAQNSNSIYPIPYPRSSVNFRGRASTKKSWVFLRRFFGLKKHHFPIHLLYKLRFCINRNFSSVY